MKSGNSIRERRLAAKAQASKAQKQLKIIGVASFAVFGLIALSSNEKIRTCYSTGMYGVLRHVESLVQFLFYANRGELAYLRLAISLDCGLR